MKPEVKFSAASLIIPWLLFPRLLRLHGLAARIGEWMYNRLGYWRIIQSLPMHGVSRVLPLNQRINFLESPWHEWAEDEFGRTVPAKTPTFLDRLVFMEPTEAWTWQQTRFAQAPQAALICHSAAEFNRLRQNYPRQAKDSKILLEVCPKQKCGLTSEKIIALALSIGKPCLVYDTAHATADQKEEPFLQAIAPYIALIHFQPPRTKAGRQELSQILQGKETETIRLINRVLRRGYYTCNSVVAEISWQHHLSPWQMLCSAISPRYHVWLLKRFAKAANKLLITTN